MFEEADAVGDARGFLTGTGHSSAFPEEGRAESALGPFPRPGAARRGSECGGRGPGAQASVPGGGPGPGRALRFRFDSLGLLYKMSRRGKGRAGGALARERRPAASGGRGWRQSRAGTHLCALRAPEGAARARAGGGVEVGSAGAHGQARRSPPGPRNTRAPAERCLSPWPPGLGLQRFWLQAPVVGNICLILRKLRVRPS